jgi:hypothetical protein
MYVSPFDSECFLNRLHASRFSRYRVHIDPVVRVAQRQPPFSIHFMRRNSILELSRHRLSSVSAMNRGKKLESVRAAAGMVKQAGEP